MEPIPVPTTTTPATASAVRLPNATRRGRPTGIRRVAGCAGAGRGRRRRAGEPGTASVAAPGSPASWRSASARRRADGRARGSSAMACWVSARSAVPVWASSLAACCNRAPRAATSAAAASRWSSASIASLASARPHRTARPPSPTSTWSAETRPWAMPRSCSSARVRATVAITGRITEIGRAAPCSANVPPPTKALQSRRPPPSSSSTATTSTTPVPRARARTSASRRRRPAVGPGSASLTTTKRSPCRRKLVPEATVSTVKHQNPRKQGECSRVRVSTL